jgi:hypothetical protein
MGAPLPPRRHHAGAHSGAHDVSDAERVEDAGREGCGVGRNPGRAGRTNCNESCERRQPGATRFLGAGRRPQPRSARPRCSARCCVRVKPDASLFAPRRGLPAPPRRAPAARRVARCPRCWRRRRTGRHRRSSWELAGVCHAALAGNGPGVRRGVGDLEGCPDNADRSLAGAHAGSVRRTRLRSSAALGRKPSREPPASGSGHTRTAGSPGAGRIPAAGGAGPADAPARYCAGNTALRALGRLRVATAKSQTP